MTKPLSLDLRERLVSAAVILLCGIVVLISAAAPDSSIAEFLDVPFS